MAKRLTDAEKKKIVADYVECGNYNEAARKNGVSDMTVKRICENAPGLLRNMEQKRAQNTLDMLAYMDSRKEQAQMVIDRYLRALADPEKIEAAKLSEIATATGILIDKFTRNVPANNDGVSAILVNVQTLDSIVGHPAPNRDISDFE